MQNIKENKGGFTTVSPPGSSRLACFLCPTKGFERFASL
jgi:hypothetical protein